MPPGGDAPPEGHQGGLTVGFQGKWHPLTVGDPERTQALKGQLRTASYGVGASAHLVPDGGPSRARQPLRRPGAVSTLQRGRGVWGRYRLQCQWCFDKKTAIVVMAAFFKTSLKLGF